jgi:hypothetical protein
MWCSVVNRADVVTCMYVCACKCVCMCNIQYSWLIVHGTPQDNANEAQILNDQGALEDMQKKQQVCVCVCACVYIDD